MIIGDYTIEDSTVSTVKEARETLKELLDNGEFTKEDYDYQIDEMKDHNESTLTAWCEKIDWTFELFENAGMIYFKPNTHDTYEILEFVGYR